MGLRQRYGASPVHVLAHLVALPLMAWALLRLADARAAGEVFTWLLVGLVAHDVALVPLYSGLDRLWQRLRVAGVPAVNHVRVPAGLSALTFLVFCGLITGESSGDLRYVSGVEPAGYLGRWLLLSAGLFAVSALWLVLRVVRAQQHVRAAGGAHHDGA